MHTIDNFIDSIHRSHLDNAQSVYMATKMGHHGQHSVSPLTNFVFEFFLFNSLYSIDWSASMTRGDIIAHKDLKEGKMQRQFIAFCRERCKTIGPEKIVEAFLPLARLDDLSGDWTKVTPDGRISVDQGERFFAKLVELGELARQGTMKANKATFDLINDCCYFVYLVRNNIFHGAKSIGTIYETNQARRIGVYDLFARCLNSLFFLSCERKKHGAALAQLAIVHRIGNKTINLTLQDVYTLLRQSRLKPEDSVLHWKMFRDNVTTTPTDWSTKRALFYPSAGRDILFPLIVGLPYCTDFYFFDSSRRLRPNDIPAILRALNLTARPVDTSEDNCDCHEFKFDSALRRIWRFRRDNTTFLDLDIPLAFFFHRGDSEGEGGSGQRWDSDLLPQLLEKSPVDSGLRILTDGEPGGLCENVKAQLVPISLPNSHRGRDYFYGVLPNTALLD